MPSLSIFVEQEQRVFHAGFDDALNDFAGHRADVGAAVAADFALVVHAAQGHTHVFAAGGFGDGLAERGFAHARGADKAEDGAFEFFAAFLHRQIFQDALFDFFQTVVVGVEHQIGFGDVFDDARFFLPRQFEQRIYIVAHHGGLGRHRRHHFEFFQFRQGFFLGLFAHAGRFDVGFELVQLRAFVFFAQFLVDGFDLLVEVILALRFFHLAFDAAFDAFFHLQDVQLGIDLADEELHAFGHVDLVEHGLAQFEFQL